MTKGYAKMSRKVMKGNLDWSFTVKLKSKLKISFILIAVMPIVALFSVVFCIGNIKIKQIENSYGTTISSVESLSNPIAIYSGMMDMFFGDICKAIEKTPNKFESTEFLDKLNGRLVSKGSFIIVRTDGEYSYCGSREDEEWLYEFLPEYDECMEADDDYYINADEKYLIKGKSYKNKNGHEKTIFLVTAIDGIIPQMKAFMVEVAVSLCLIIVATSIVLSLWIHRSVVRPLEKLGAATRRIANGDLDSPLDKGGCDEFGLLYNDFEDMRIRLKQAAVDRMHDEEENKELISNISHDLKTPITAIKGYVEGIMDGVADTPEKMDKYIHTIYNKANDMDRLIGELTMYSRIDTNRMPYNFAKVNVKEYFSDCMDELSYELDARNIKLGFFNYTDEDTVIIADAEQMKRVINNIVSNSVKYIGNKPGILNIRIHDEGDFIHVEIEDNGKGIDKKDLPYIFDRFYRTDASRNSNQGGSGIGLSIVKKIIEAHGGKIWANSMLGTGTTMHFVIRKYIERM